MVTPDKIISTLRPGLLVSLTIRIMGNVSYKTKDLEKRRRASDGSEHARWETERIVENAAELKRAEKVRAEARQLVNKTCARSSFGLLCPTAWEKDLHANIAQARKLAAEFNAKSKCTEVGVYAIVGRVAQDDVEAVRAINSEVRELMKEMTDGLKDLDVKRVREAAGRARSVGMMLSEEASAKVKVAIEAARAQARKIVKAGDTVSGAIDKEVIKKINQARTTFLDLDSGAAPMKPTARARAVDLDPEAKAPKAAPKKKAKPTQLELGGLSVPAAKAKAARKVKAPQAEV